jgi:aminoglycoside phosphotransferase (APT) family kinase protein
MSDYLDQTQPVRPGEELNVAALEAHLRTHLSGLEGSLTVEQFPHGHSNLTYLLRAEARELVLRRPPFGNQVKSAHDMEREYRVLSKLCKVYPPAPVPYLFCGDDAVIGAPFYVMERRHGVVLRKTRTPGLNFDAETLRRLCETLVDNLALLHSIDHVAAGLGDLGRPEGYVERQVSGWTKRYRNAQTEDIPDLERVMTWLAEDMPAETGAALIHNDYKFDNLLLDPADLTQVVAVLDWEMATVGDPLMDLGTTLGYWVEAGDPAAFRAVAFGPTDSPSSMTRREVAERYCERTGGDGADILFYYVYGLFKIAVIIQQIYARFVRGFTRDERFRHMNQVIAVLGQQAVRAIESGQIG